MTRVLKQQKRDNRTGKGELARATHAAAFVEAYLTNGHNAAAAAAAAGCGGKNPRNVGWKLLQKPEVKDLLARRAEEIAEEAGLNAKDWARQLRAIAFSSVGNLFSHDGQLVPVSQLPPNVQASLSSVKASEDGTAIEYKFWDKPTALQIMARHLGLFERDNAQGSDITVRVELVG